MLGFPIRISTGRSSFAAHRSFSQLTTSFIGSWCQGIRPVLLLALSLRTQYHSRQGGCRVHLLLFFVVLILSYIFSMHELLKSIEIAVGNRYLFYPFPYLLNYLMSFFSANYFTIISDCFSSLYAVIKVLWWAKVDSNHRPHAYQACALTD